MFQWINWVILDTTRYYNENLLFDLKIREGDLIDWYLLRL